MKTNGTLPVIVKETIDLNDKEKQIFDRLHKVIAHFNLETKLRVVGGWVRDKLLGKECYDIDIALDNMLGREFCEKINKYLVSTCEETQGFDVIQSNPDKSKHLETTRMSLFHVWIDFVHLRSEDCNLQFGSPEEDAYRRDLTINALFYNINTCLVEDFTKRGLDDLKFGKIVTPLPPKVTFLDDPLRVLRAIRFSTRFGFEMVEELKVAALNNDVKSAILGKVSKERIAFEIDLMVNGNQPTKALTYIYDLGLFSIVFTPPTNHKPLILEENEKSCVEYMDLAWRQFHEVGCNFTDKQRRLYLYASLFLPIRNTVYVDNKDKMVSVVNYILKNSLKCVSLKTAIFNGFCPTFVSLKRICIGG
ncbi:hypothetical protein Lser_V15G31017 [Lactuca serriola]